MDEHRGELISEDVSRNHDHREDQHNRNNADEDEGNDQAVTQSPKKFGSDPADQQPRSSADGNKLEESCPAGKNSRPPGRGNDESKKLENDEECSDPYGEPREPAAWVNTPLQKSALRVTKELLHGLLLFRRLYEAGGYLTRAQNAKLRAS